MTPTPLTLRLQSIFATAEAGSSYVVARARQKLGALIQGYKTRRILKNHSVVGQLKTDYRDLLSFAFGLQQELKQLDLNTQ